MPSFASSGGSADAETGRGVRMIDWHHPRIYERLRCFGLSLFTIGVASHNVANPPVALAAIVVAILLVVRLRIELEIGRDEEETSLERKLRHIDLINALAIGPAVLGALVLLRRFSDVGMFIEG
jgi:hypothetical protein